MRLLLPALLIALSAPALAQNATSTANDSRIASLTWYPGARLPVSIAPGNSVMLVFAPLEKVLSISLDDSSNVQAVTSSTGDSITIHTLRALPSTAMSVKTDQRSYDFVLQPSGGAPVPYMVRLSLPSQFPVGNPQSVAAPTGIVGYKLSGTVALRPVAMGDDGTHIYIKWAADQLIPAVFAVNDVGGEEMVDGYMRGDVFVIDRVHRRLVFRFDKAAVKAVKIDEKVRR